MGIQYSAVGALKKALVDEKVADPSLQDVCQHLDGVLGKGLPYPARYGKCRTWHCRVPLLPTDEDDVQSQRQAAGSD
jgi:hypothetical protein